MTPTEQFTDAMYANRVFGTIQVRQHTRQLAAELGFPESILGEPKLPLPPPPAKITIWDADQSDAEWERQRLQWRVQEHVSAAIELPDTHSHFPILTGVA